LEFIGTKIYALWYLLQIPTFFGYEKTNQ